MNEKEFNEVYDNAKEARKEKGRKEKEVESTQGGGLNITRDDLLQIIKVAREPNELEKRRMERELAKDEEEAKRAAALREEMVRIAAIEIEGREKFQNETCRHRKERGESAVMGQIHSDGLYHPLCLRCGKMFDPIAPPREFLAQGIMVD